MGEEECNVRGMEKSLALVNPVCPQPRRPPAVVSIIYFVGKVQNEHIFTAPLFKLGK